MNTRTKTCAFLLPTLLALGLVVPAHGAAQSPLRAETYGRPSGDVPLDELGLVLELVGGGTTEARLRLFGGLPGHPAAIVVSASRPGAGAEASGAMPLVGPALLTQSGSFDWTGTFELPLTGLALAAGEVLYAQGLHAGILELGGAPPRQWSHGLELHPVTEAEAPLWFDEWLPHLPAVDDLAGARGLAERLQRMLNSAGDQVRLALELEVTLGLGIEVVDAKAGGKLACEFTVERTDEGLYEVVVGADLAALAGVSAGTGAEVGAEASSGAGTARLFRFHSAPGAARGMLGLVLALRFPELQPGRFLAGSELLGDAGERLAELRAVAEELRAQVEELEAFLREALERAVARAEAARRAASDGLAAALRAHAAAPWWQRPARWAQVVAWQVTLAGASANLTVARTAMARGEAALEAARAAVAAKQAEILAGLQAAARVGRVAAAIAQLRGWAASHAAGFELRTTKAAEVEAKVKAPVVDLKNFGLAASAELERQFVTRFEPGDAPGSGRITVLQSLQLERKASAGLVLGGELAHARRFEVEEVFEVVDGRRLAPRRTLSFTSDASVVGAVGLIVARESGFGRTRSFELSHEHAGDLASLLSPADLGARLAAAEIGFALQDRRQENLDLAFAIDVTGNGGGIELELEWADQGRSLQRNTTVGEGLEVVLHGSARVPDGVSGTVVPVE
ncbi:MAG TPA: hypothetical protein VF530_09050 [Planctomycetota bacterium]